VNNALQFEDYRILHRDRRGSLRASRLLDKLTMISGASEVIVELNLHEAFRDSARRADGARLAKASEPRAEAARTSYERRGRRVHRLSLPGVPRSESARIAAIRWSDEEERGGGGGNPVDAPRSRSTRSQRRRRWRRRSALNHPCPFTGVPWNACRVQAPKRTNNAKSGGFRWTSPPPGHGTRDRVVATEVNDRRATRIAGRVAEMNDRGDVLRKCFLRCKHFPNAPRNSFAALYRAMVRGSVRSNGDRFRVELGSW